MYGIAAQSGGSGVCAKSTAKSGALASRLPSGCTQKAIACVASLAKRRMAVAAALASELLKRNASFKNGVNRPWLTDIQARIKGEYQ